MVKNPPANAGDVGSIPGWGRSPGEGNGNPIQCSCLENHMDRGAWWAAVHGVTKSWTRVTWSFRRVLFRSRSMGKKWCLPCWFGGKEPTCQCRRCGFDYWVGKTPWRRKWQPTSLFLRGKSHGQRSLEGYSPCDHKRVGHDLATKQ